MAEIDEILERLKERKRAFESEIERLEQIIALFQQAQEILNPDALSAFARQADIFTDSYREPARKRGHIRPQDVATAVKNTLIEIGRPMNRGELVKELEKRNFPLSGKDKNKNLGTILWRYKDQFVSLEGLGYWVREVPLEGVYSPATHIEE